MSLPRIVITLNGGGLVTNVFCDVPARVVTVDYDVEGLSEDDPIEMIPQRGLASEAYVCRFDSEVIPESLQGLEPAP